MLPVPQNFRAFNTQVGGQIILRWGKAGRRAVYVVEYTTDINDPAQLKRIQITKTKLILNDLNPDKRYFFRVSTNCTAGNSGFTPWISYRPN